VISRLFATWTCTNSRLQLRHWRLTICQCLTSTLTARPTNKQRPDIGFLNKCLSNTMPRKLTKSASASASRSSSKRPVQDTPTRQSKRARVTARKSYAEADSDDDEEAIKNASVPSDDESVAEASDFEEPGDGDQSSESEQDEAPTSDEDAKPKKGASRVQSAKKSIALHSKHGDEKDLWKAGAKLEPGTQLIIKKPKARGKHIPERNYCETPTDVTSPNYRSRGYTIYG
jgi:hypothetical protein